MLFRENMGLLKKITALAGLVMIVAAVANVEFGALMQLDPPQKLILARAADPGCNSEEIQKDLDDGAMNECVTSIGVWDGLIYFLSQKVRFFYCRHF